MHFSPITCSLLRLPNYHIKYFRCKKTKASTINRTDVATVIPNLFDAKDTVRSRLKRQLRLCSDSTVEMDTCEGASVWVAVVGRCEQRATTDDYVNTAAGRRLAALLHSAREWVACKMTAIFRLPCSSPAQKHQIVEWRPEYDSGTCFSAFWQII
jgi:hypothetical protein